MKSMIMQLRLEPVGHLPFFEINEWKASGANPLPERQEWGKICYDRSTKEDPISAAQHLPAGVPNPPLVYVRGPAASVRPASRSEWLRLGTIRLVRSGWRKVPKPPHVQLAENQDRNDWV